MSEYSGRENENEILATSNIIASGVTHCFHECQRCGGWTELVDPASLYPPSVKDITMKRRDGSVAYVCSDCFADVMLAP